jgi:ATP-binding cassette subfamily B protein
MMGSGGLSGRGADGQSALWPAAASLLFGLWAKNMEQQIQSLRPRARRAKSKTQRIASSIPVKFKPGGAEDIVPPPWEGNGATTGEARSSFLQTPPDDVRRLLAERAISSDELVLFTDSDIDIAGNYARQWLAVTREQLLVISETAGSESEQRPSNQALASPLPSPGVPGDGVRTSPLVGGPGRVVLELALKDASEIRCESVIGSGLVQARVDGVFVDLLRYSNSRSDRFSKVARKLDRSLRGETITLDADDEIDPRRCKSCGLLLDFAGETCPHCVNKGAVLARMWKLMLPYRRAASGMMALLVGGIALDLVGPKLTQYLIDHVLPANAQAASAIGANPAQYHSHLTALLYIVLTLAGVQIVRMVINIFNGRLSTRVGTAITYDMRGRLVQHLQQLSVSYYDRQQVGSLVARVAYDTEALQGFVSQLTGGFLFQIVMIVLVGVMMFSINAKLALFTLVPAPLVILGSVVFWKFIYPRYYRFWDAASKQAGMLSGMLSGVRVVKAFGQEDRETDRFNAASEYLTSSRRNVDFSMCTFNPIMGLVFQLGGWIVWYVGGRDVLGGELTLGAMMAFFGYLWMFYSPLGALTQFTNWLTSFVTQAHRIFEILDTPVQITDAKEPVSEQLKGEITFENVTFGYNRHHQVLRDVNLHIKPGEMIGVVGRSGSGKSTMVNLICRFYDVNEGRVLMDGRDVRDFAKDGLRKQIGVVLQEPFLFRGSIAENVAYGKPDASPEEIINAAKAGNCHDFILRSPHAYDTWVGERGAGLSGGERQRVSIARVLLTDPKVLILDEATSSVDAESEAAIQAAMAEVVKGRTTIAIAHRLSTLRNADRILVIDNGRIAESGNHEELIAQDGLYARLAKIQGQLAPPPTIDNLVADEAEAARHLETDGGDSSGDDDRRAMPALPDPRGFRARWLSPDIAKIHIGGQSTLHVTVLNERTYGGVFAVRCMPVKYPRQYISLRHLDH